MEDAKLKLIRQASTGIGQTNIEYDPYVMANLNNKIAAKKN